MSVQRRPNESEVRSRAIWQWFRRPSVSILGGIGVGLVAVAAWAANPWGAMGLIGIGALATAVLRGLYLATFRREARQQEALSSLQADATNAHLAELRSLRQHLLDERDPQSSALVRRLREVFLRIVDGNPWASRYAERAVYDDAREQALRLYESCLQLLARSVQFAERARKMATSEAQQQLLARREALVGEVNQGIDHLEASLDQLETAGAGEIEPSRAEHRVLLDELSQGLEVARNVENRLDALEREVQGPEHHREP